MQRICRFRRRDPHNRHQLSADFQMATGYQEMIPLAALKLVPWRLVGYGLAAVAVALLAWRIHAWREGYLERKAAVAELADERKGRAADRTAYESSLAESQAKREALQADFAKIRGKFAALTVPPPKELTSAVEVPIAAGQTTCPSPRISLDFVRVFNTQASP